MTANEEIVVAGETDSADFPVTSEAYDTELDDTEGFVARLSADGTTLRWATFLGGSESDYVEAVALTASEKVVIAGWTHSADFPVTEKGSIQSGTDGFVAQLSQNGASLHWATFLGGSEVDIAQAMALTTGEEIVVAGYTSSPDLPVTDDAFDTSFQGSQDGFIMQWVPGSGTEPTPHPTPDRTPIVFIPGIAGSTLYAKDGKELWPAPWLYNRHARLNEEGVVAGDAVRTVGFESAVEWTTYQVYQPILDMLIQSRYREYIVDNEPLRRTTSCDVAGQKDAQPTLFVFAYDWRLDIEDNAALLAEYVKCVQQFYPGTKVDILAHSMGGLVARRYIIQHGGDATVSKLLTFDTPWLGSPHVLWVMLSGKFTKGSTTEPSIIRKVIVHFDGAHQLLPSQKLLDITGQAVLQEQGVDLNNNGKDDDVYSSLESLRSVFQALDYPTDPVATNNTFYTAAQLDWSGIGSGIEYHVIWGKQKGNTTIAGLKVGSGKLCEDVGLIGFCPLVPTTSPALIVEGDGSVPLASLKGVQNPPANFHLYELPSDDPAHNSQYEHLEILANPASHCLVKEILGLGPTCALSAQSSVTLDDQTEVVPLRYISLWRVDALTITHPLSGTVSTIDGSISFLQLPGMTVHALDERSYLVIVPPSEPYTFTFTSTTSHKLEITEGGGNNVVTQVARYTDQPLMQSSEQAVLTLTPNEFVQLGRDRNGDGAAEILVPPSGIAIGDAATDNTPPRVTVAATPIDHDTAMVTVTATDNKSGVKTIRYSQDGEQYRLYSAPFTVPAGTTVYAFADDVAGNRSQETSYQVPQGQSSQRIFLPTLRR